jgi:Zn-finger nucleic acid-binding protein
MVDKKDLTVIDFSDDPAKFEKLSSHSVSAHDTSDPLRCPRCYNPTITRSYKTENHTIAIDECELCGAVWFDPNELELIQNDFESSKAVIEDLRQQSIAARRKISRETAEEPAPREVDERELANEMMTDVISLIGMIGIASLTLFLKYNDWHIWAGATFAVVTLIAVVTAIRFARDSGREWIAATGVGLLGGALSVLVWYWGNHS